MPMWTIYEPWGWGTGDADQAMSYLRRFGSVTVLNGHIHQIVQKVEGNITFHTARSTAYPQPAGRRWSGAGAADRAAGPAAENAGRHQHQVPANIAGVADRRDPGLNGEHPCFRNIFAPLLAALLMLVAAAQWPGAALAQADANTIVMKNFDFSPMMLTVKAGTTVTWKNLDGEPHTVVSPDGRLPLPCAGPGRHLHLQVR